MLSSIQDETKTQLNIRLITSRSLCTALSGAVSCVQREALVVVFQRWFSVAAEEASVASELSVYLRAVRRSTPSLLAFLVNLADDNDNTVLHYSVSHCNYSVVSLLLETGAQVPCCCCTRTANPTRRSLTATLFFSRLDAQVCAT